MSALGPLDLSDGDFTGFAPLDSGQYRAEVFKMEMDSVKNADGQGKMPAGTPMIKVQYKILNPRIDGVEVEQDRRAFQTFVIPPKKYDAAKAKVLKGMIGRFFEAIGFPEEQVRSAGFEPDFDDCVGRPCTITLSKEEYPPNQDPPVYQNRVKAVKKAGSEVATGSGLL